YAGNGTGELRIDDATQAAIEAAGAGTLAEVAEMQAAVAAAGEIDLRLRRDRFNSSFELAKLSPISVKVDFGYEKRKGSRPYGGNFGFGNAVEIPEPIDYNTYNTRLDVEYAGKWLYADASYFHSTFDNQIQSVLYDNPRRLTTLPFEGRNALPPSNSYDAVTVTLATELPLHSRLTLTGNHGWMRQDEKLLDLSINPSALAVAPPRETADAKVDTALYEATLTSHPTDKLHVKASGRYYKRENNTPVQTFQYYRADSSTLSGPATLTYVDWISRTLGGEAAYEIFSRTNLGFEYEYESETYKNGSSPTERMNTFKVFADSRAMDWLTGRVSFEYSNRNSKYPDYILANAELPWMRKFYAADRDRYQARAMSMIMPTDDLSMTLEYVFNYNKYPNSDFGLRDGRDHIATADMDYTINDMLSVHSLLGYENHRTNQRSRYWTTTVSNPYTPPSLIDDPSNWSLNLTDNVYTVSMGAKARIIPDKLTFDVDGLYTIVDGDADFESAVGAAGTDNNRFIPDDYNNIDETELWKISARLGYNVTKAFNVALGYSYEAWSIDDYLYDGVTEVATNAGGTYNGLLDMNTLYKDYIVHTVTLGATYMF
ncbi:MAG TPA: MtrB/PioB family outer membrane beta-barrel protein, partial [Nitrospirota bacterium]